jgi:hypothetical protein
MNGRAYDPGLGRFLSVDPFVQDLANSQNLNPYSYILNNPLSGTDPTGYSPEQELKNAQKGHRTLMQAIAGDGGGDELIFNGAGSLADTVAFLAGNKAPHDLGSPQGSEESRMRFVESPLGDVTTKLTESVFTEEHLQLGLLTGIAGPVIGGLTAPALATAHSAGLRLLTNQLALDLSVGALEGFGGLSGATGALGTGIAGTVGAIEGKAASALSQGQPLLSRMLGRGSRVFGDIAEKADTPLIITARHPLLQGAPQHHIFPQQYRAWFAERGVEIDRYVLELDRGVHEALHYGRGTLFPGGGYWNTTIMTRLLEREAKVGRLLLKREVLKIGAVLRRETNLKNVKVKNYGER